MNRLLFILSLAFINAPVAAQTIYKCTDQHGGTLISNTKVNKDCKAVASSNEPPAPTVRPGANRAVNAQTPANFPRVPEGEQKSRDTDRQRILEQELASEQAALDVARKELAAQEVQRGVGDKTAAKMTEHLQSYKDKVSQHERNLQALQKELSKLR